MSKTPILIQSARTGLVAVVILLILYVAGALAWMYVVASRQQGTYFVILDFGPVLKSPEAWGIVAAIFAAGFFWQYRKVYH
jgi:hypothetical protein